MPGRTTPTPAAAQPVVAGSPPRRRWLDVAADATRAAGAETTTLAPVQPLRPAPRGSREPVLAEMLDVLPVALVRFDADGAIDFVNPRASKLLQSLGLRPALRSGWVLLETLDARLARRTRAALRHPATVAERKRVFVRPAGQRPAELAVSVQVLDGRACLVTVEEACAAALRPTVG